MGRINVTSSIFAELLSSNNVLISTAEMMNDRCLKQDILVGGAQLSSVTATRSKSSWRFSVTLYCLEVRMSDLCHCSPANAVLIVKQATLAMFTGRGPVPMGPLALWKCDLQGVLRPDNAHGSEMV